jgi:photosystem II stability/assembly factor-like uncharacterized protein
MRCFAATGEDVVRVDDATATAVLEGVGAQCVAVDPRDPQRVFVGTFDRGVFRTRDGGDAWDPVADGIPHGRVLSVAVSPCDLENDLSVLYAGTEPSSVYRSADDGSSWDDVSVTLRELPSAPTWSFPPRPWTHHARWIAPHQTRPDVLYVGIELGGVLRTLDGGHTWEDRHPDAVIDPHVLRTHAVASDRVYAVGGDGVSYSQDEGATWQRDTDGMDRWYTWGLAVDPEDPELWYASASTGPMQAHGEGDAQARLYRKWGRGPWEPLELDGLGGVKAPLDRMPYSLAAPAPGTIVCGLRDGTLFVSDDAGSSWRATDAQIDGIVALAIATP